MDIDYLRTWAGRQESLEDVVTPAKVAALGATLDWAPEQFPSAGSALPPPWHWMFCIPVARQSAIGPDGHPARGGFLPPVPLPRRMWAGGRLTFPQDIRVGDTIRRESEVVSVEHKRGRSGELVFVLVRHAYHGPSGIAITEEHDIVYRDMPDPSLPAPAFTPAPKGAQGEWERLVVPDDVLLFRYSALTFNGHRIHYDRRYVTEVEGYPGLIVHGPLIATLLLDLLRRNLPDARVTAFEFKAVKPVFDIEQFFVCGQPQPDGKTVKLWARDAEGWLTMTASATLA